MTKNIYLYSDAGANDFCIESARFHFESYLPGCNVKRVMAYDVITDGIPDDVDLFIMPGGADKPYAQALSGQGNKNIRTYVENGGTYLGLCAGAYYGCSSIEFQKGLPYAICEDRELGFFKGIGVGCLSDIAPLYDTSLQCARLVGLTTAKGQQAASIYWGGCSFIIPTQATNVDIDSDSYEIIARYDDVTDKPPAIITCTIGKGRAILSGVHFEMTLPAFESLYQLDKPEDAQTLEHLKHTMSTANKVMMVDIMKEYL